MCSSDLLSQFTTALLVGQVSGATAVAAITVHRSTGAVTWVVVVTRLVWRSRFASLPPFPASMPKIQQLVAKLNEYGLYALLLVQPVTGIAFTLLRGRPFALLFWQVPALVAADRPLAHILYSVHIIGAWALLGLIGLHAGAALLHGVVLRDGVLPRMLPWTAR